MGLTTSQKARSLLEEIEENEQENCRLRRENRQLREAVKSAIDPSVIAEEVSDGE